MATLLAHPSRKEAGFSLAHVDYYLPRVDNRIDWAERYQPVGTVSPIIILIVLYCSVLYGFKCDYPVGKIQLLFKMFISSKDILQYIVWCNTVHALFILLKDNPTVSHLKQKFHGSHNDRRKFEDSYHDI